MKRNILVTLTIILLTVVGSGCAGMQEKIAEYADNYIKNNTAAKASVPEITPATTMTASTPSQESYSGNGVIECKAPGEKDFYKIRVNKDDDILSIKVIDGRNQTVYNGKASRDTTNGFFINKADKTGAQYALSEDNKLILRGFFQIKDCPNTQTGLFIVKPQDVYTSLD